MSLKIHEGEKTEMNAGSLLIGFSLVAKEAIKVGPLLIGFSLVVTVISLVFYVKSGGEDNSFKILARRLFYISCVSITFAVIILFVAFLTHQFQCAYVYNYSSRDLGLLYLISGVWAGQEGSFLFWVFLLYIFGFFIIRSNDKYENILMIIISLTQIFILVTLVKPNYGPFRYIWDSHPNQFRPGVVPMDGTGLNPLLQNPWMVVHPPVLFLGYASATIPYAYAIAAMWKNDYSSWITRGKKWVLFCMTFLGIGIFLGGFWAYLVLGWGGYWGWDPVENSSFIPWLIVVALMHGLILQKRKGALLKTNIVLSLLSLILVFYSTFLTRSGVLSDFSVHSFGDLGLSGPLIFFIIFFILLGFGLFIWRFKNIKSSSLGEKLLSQENIISLGVIILLIYALFILFGTSMPIISKALMPNPTSVQSAFYNNISIPFSIMFLFFLAFSTKLITTKKLDLKILIILSVSSLLIAVLFNLGYTKNIFAYIITTLALIVIVYSVTELIKYKTSAIISSRLSHIGIGILVVGIIASNLHSTSQKKELIENRETNINNIKITFKGMFPRKKSETDKRIDDISKSFKEIKDKDETTKGKPGLIFELKDGSTVHKVKTIYYNSKKTNSLYREPYIKYGFFNDIYISPVELKSGAGTASKYLLSAGKEEDIRGIKFKFERFNTKNMNMMGGKGTLLTEISVTVKGKKSTISPGIVIISGNIDKYIEKFIPGTRRKVSVDRIDVMKKQILIFIEPEDKNAPAPDSTIIEISFKRFMWLVWAGTILIAAGSFVAYRKTKIT